VCSVYSVVTLFFMRRVVIVGGGITGLSLAYRLSSRSGMDVTHLEASDRLGGCVRTIHKDGFTIECGPNGFLDSSPATLQLARDIGLGDKLLAASESSSRKRYLYLGDRLHALPNSIGRLLRSPLLGMAGKLALMAEPVRPRRRESGPESVADFARRRAGREAAELFADALVTGIHGGDPELLDVRSAFPRLVNFESADGSVIRGLRKAAKRKRAAGEKPTRPKLWSFRDGLGVLIGALAERLPTKPVLGAAVRGIERGENGWIVRGDGSDSWTADAVVLTCPAYQQAAIVADLDVELAQQLGEIAYNRIAVVALGYPADDVPKAYDGFGYIAPQRLRRDVLGVQWCSAIFPARAPHGFVLWRALCGGWHRGDVVDWPDDRLLAAVQSEIRLATGVDAQPTFTHIVRWRRAIPQYLLGHPERVAAIEARAAQFPGLILGGNALYGISLNDCVEWAERTALAI
jgi:protoporphyrinogen/coproporphyrinogen III oxidase